MSLFYILLVEVQFALVIVLHLGVLYHLLLVRLHPPVSSPRMEVCILMRLNDALLHIALDPLHGSLHVLNACTHTRMPRLTRGIEPL